MADNESPISPQRSGRRLGLFEKVASRFSNDRIKPGLYLGYAAVRETVNFGPVIITQIRTVKSDEGFALKDLPRGQTLIARVEHYHEGEDSPCLYRAQEPTIFMQPWYTIRAQNIPFLNPILFYQLEARLQDVHIEGFK
ncbi:MAG: hypothetical protein ACP5NS_00995 [Candidatus Pacearchaeota archaeon]